MGVPQLFSMVPLQTSPVSVHVAPATIEDATGQVRTPESQGAPDASAPSHCQ